MWLEHFPKLLDLKFLILMQHITLWVSLKTWVWFLTLKIITVTVLYQMYQKYPNYIFLGEERLGTMMDVVDWFVQHPFYLLSF